MKNVKQKFTKEELINEPPVKAHDFLVELKPILEDFFAGKISIEGNVIMYYLPNGQRFIIKATAVNF